MRLAHHTHEMVTKNVELGYWTNDDMCLLWDRCALVNPKKVALVDSKTRLTFEEAKLWSDRIAFSFDSLGITREQTLAAQYGNGVQAFLTDMATRKLGVPIVRCPTTLRHKEITHILRASKAVGMVVDPIYRNFSIYDMIEEIRPELPDLKYIFVLGGEIPANAISVSEMTRTPLERDYPRGFAIQHAIRPGEVGVLLATSGSTGTPKVVAAPNYGIAALFQQVQRWKLSVDDVIAAFSPYFGGGGCAIYAAPVVGARVAFLEKFDAEGALRLIEQERVTFVSMVPAQMAMMVRHPDLDKFDLSSLRIIYYAASTCPYSLIEEIEAKMGCHVLSLYGMTEGGYIATSSYDDPFNVRALSVGKLFAGVEAKVLSESGDEVAPGEIGELSVRGAMVASSVLDESGSRPAWGDDPQGWVRTGDLIKEDEDGNLYVVGRAKDVIIRGGQNIYPREIEDILVTHPKVLNVAVVPMPDPIMGEKCCAYVITRGGKEPLTFQEMVDFLMKERMAKYKLPERLEIVTEFPMALDQKVSKKELTADVTRKLKAEGKLP